MQRKKWRDLTITDDYMFKLIMSYKRICKHLIERILGIEVKDIAYIENEYPLKSTHESKGVRLDVFVADTAGSRFVLEMQVRNYGAREIGRRSRFYQTTIDFDFLTTGGSIQRPRRRLCDLLLPLPAVGRRASCLYV